MTWRAPARPDAMGASLDKPRGPGGAHRDRTLPRFRPSGLPWDGGEAPAPADEAGPMRDRGLAEAAHDFNNILSVVMSCADELLATPLSSEQAERVREIRAAGRRAVALNHRLIDGARQARRPGSGPWRSDVGRTIASCEPWLERTLGRRVELVIDVPDGLPDAGCSAEDLAAALLNMASNARDAMPGGGTFAIRASRATLDAEDPVLGAGWYVRLDVIDDGAGMTPRVLRRALDPYFTTKGDRGTGLGLPAVAQTARDAGGDLRVASAPGRGTTVTMLIPAVGANGDRLALGV